MQVTIPLPIDDIPFLQEILLQIYTAVPHDIHRRGIRVLLPSE